MGKNYMDLQIQKWTNVLLIAGALILFVQGVFDVNPFPRVLFILIGVAGFYNLLFRDFYLPFLGKTVMPCTGLEERTPSGADTNVTVSVSPFAKVLYWAAEPSADELKNINDWKVAYSSFENLGVTTADQTGQATLSVRKPQPYSVPFKGRLNPHIHYRVCGEDGMMDPVRTVFLDSVGTAVTSEGFQSGSGSGTGLEFVTQVDPNKFLSELTRDPKKLQSIIGLLPGITEIMNQLQSTLASNTTSVQPSHHVDAPTGQTLAEAFRNY
jgi:hypothetical protein